MAYISQIKLSNTTYDISAVKLKNARTIFGQSFDGTANVAGKPMVYGSYTSTASSRYYNSGIEVRENGLVGNTQSDIGYAPSIGFHWGGRIAASLLFHSDGNFYLRKQDGVSRANLDANLIGNASTASKLATARTISLTGSVTGSGSFDGSGNLSIATTVNHNHDSSYVKKSGDTMSGLLKAHGGISLNSSTAESTGLTYVLGIKAFADGGNIIWSSAGNVSVGAANKLNSDAGSSTKAIYFSGGKPVQCNSTIAHDITGNAATATALAGSASGGAVPLTDPGAGRIRYYYNVNSGLTGNMPVSNNANGILYLNTHNGEYGYQLGFSSNGNIYYRNKNGSAFTESTTWNDLAPVALSYIITVSVVPS